MRIETNIIPKSHFLNQRTAIEAGLSDHNLLIQGRTVFFNMMMQGRWNSTKKRYNNGFALNESDNDYQDRICNVVRVLAETICLNPHIKIIGLVEAPIKAADINIMINEAKKHPSLKPFIATMIDKNFTSMGIATFVNSDYFLVNSNDFNSNDLRPSLVNRIQKFELIAKDGTEHFNLVNLHLPYDLAKSPDTRELISFSRNLFSNRNNVPTLVMGDFNIHPRKIAQDLLKIAFFIQTNNNILIRANKLGKVTHTEFDTVDGILQTNCLKEQNIRYHDVKSLPHAGVDLYLQHRLFRPIRKPGTQKEKENLIAQDYKPNRQMQ